MRVRSASGAGLGLVATVDALLVLCLLTTTEANPQALPAAADEAKVASQLVQIGIENSTLLPYGGFDCLPKIMPTMVGPAAGHLCCALVEKRRGSVIAPEPRRRRIQNVERLSWPGLVHPSKAPSDRSAGCSATATPPPAP